METYGKLNKSYGVGKGTNPARRPHKLKCVSWSSQCLANYWQTLRVVNFAAGDLIHKPLTRRV